MIAKATGEHLSHISRAMRELEENGLARCLTPKRPKNRYYEITSKGEEVLSLLIKAEGAKD
ncbi:MAG: hypothetical protein ACXABY_08615 [Candidatus Thorarchaeota archaeon]|jgi:DNA-binding PadR family transcriptional regulator